MSTISSSTTNTTALNFTADTTGNIVFQTGSTPTTAVTILTNQRVGFGVTNPGYAVDVVSDETSNGYAQRIRSNATATKARLQFTNSGATVENGYIETSDSQYMAFSTAGSERMRINAGSAILCLAGGSTSATGTGIAFPATQSASSDANTLDDYEEGTWTPVVTSQSGSITSYTASGTYTKIGRTVILYGNVYLTNTGTASGQLNISSGVPFSTLGSNQYMGTCRETTATGNIYFPLIVGSSIAIQNSTNGGVAWGTNYRYEFINVYQTS